MRSVTETLAVALFGTAVLLSVPAVHAQSPQPMQAQPPAEPAAPVSEKKLDAAAAPPQQVTTLRQSYQEKIDKAPPEQQEQIANEGNNALQKAVTDQGLSLDEYNSILQLAQNDPTVRAKLLQRLQPQQ